MIRFFFCFIIFFTSVLAFSQLNYGGYGGVSLNFGNKQTRIGVIVGGFLNYNYAQINLKTGSYYNLKSIGIETTTFEKIISVGIVAAYGAKDSTKIMFNTVVDNNTYRKNSLGFAWNYYWDKQNTSQATGIVMLGFNKVQISAENDLFGGKSGLDDKFRTGAFRVSYQYQNWELVWKNILYTGDLDERRKITSYNYPARFGYFDNKNAIYATKSLGISALEVRHKLPYQQIVSASFGIDSEWVRYGIQNWLLHDSYFIPKKWIKYPNYHIPMLTENGSQYLFNTEQKVKPASFYFQLGVNSRLFY